MSEEDKPNLDTASIAARLPPPPEGLEALPRTTARLIPGISRLPMPEVTRAGVDLANWVLTITGLSIFALVAYLMLTDVRASANLDVAYQRAIAEVSRLPADDGRLPLLLAELRRARADPTWDLSAGALAEATSAVDSLARDAATTDDQRKTLKSCLPIPAAARDRDGVLDACIALIGLKTSMSDASGARIKAITDLTKQASEQQASFRTFWIQAAQLILLNLLLPLLTALLGYIFGTSQAHRAD